MAMAGGPPSTDAPHSTLVPVIARAQAGDWTEVEDPFAVGAADEFLQTELQVNSGTFAVVIEGRSMEPEFQPGDKVIIDPEVKPRPGDFVIAKRDNDQEATFKKYRLRNQDEQGRDIIELTPLNSDWPSLMIDRDNPGYIVGTMVEHRRYRRG
jgi:SOS-response transcriptional repressor LexA